MCRHAWMFFWRMVGCFGPLVDAQVTSLCEIEKVVQCSYLRVMLYKKVNVLLTLNFKDGALISDTLLLVYLRHFFCFSPCGFII